MAEGSLHIVMFPWLAFGHMITFLELSKSLAKRGHHISFLSTPRNILRLPKLPPTLAPLIDFIPIHLPPSNELPDNTEATIDLLPADVEHLKKAYDGLHQLIAKFLQDPIGLSKTSFRTGCRRSPPSCTSPAPCSTCSQLTSTPSSMDRTAWGCGDPRGSSSSCRSGSPSRRQLLTAPSRAPATSP